MTFILRLDQVMVKMYTTQYENEVSMLVASILQSEWTHRQTHRQHKISIHPHTNEVTKQSEVVM